MKGSIRDGRSGLAAIDDEVEQIWRQSRSLASRVIFERSCRRLKAVDCSKVGWSRGEAPRPAGMGSEGSWWGSGNAAEATVFLEAMLGQSYLIVDVDLADDRTGLGGPGCEPCLGAARSRVATARVADCEAADGEVDDRADHKPRHTMTLRVARGNTGECRSC